MRPQKPRTCVTVDGWLIDLSFTPYQQYYSYVTVDMTPSYRRYMDEILPIWRKTVSNQSILPSQKLYVPNISKNEAHFTDNADVSI